MTTETLKLSAYNLGRIARLVEADAKARKAVRLDEIKRHPVHSERVDCCDLFKYDRDATAADEALVACFASLVLTVATFGKSARIAITVEV